MTQYVCNDEIGGPTGCLQYFHATSGTVASFNYPIGTSSIASATTSMSTIYLRAPHKESVSTVERLQECHQLQQLTVLRVDLIESGVN